MAASRLSAGEIHWQGQQGRYPQRAGRHGTRHCACAREPSRPGALPQPADRPQHQPAGLRPLEQRPGHQPRATRRPTPTSRSATSASRRRAAACSCPAMSGGNQQKVVIGKWLSHGARLFIFDEPTVGVDVGTKAEIYRLFAKLLKDGAGHHPDFVLSARGLRTGRHAACVPERPGRGEPRLSHGVARGSPQRSDRCLSARANQENATRFSNEKQMIEQQSKPDEGRHDH